MIILIALLLGIAVGFWRAKRAGKPTLDILQYMAVHGIFFCLLGLAFVVIVNMFSFA